MKPTDQEYLEILSLYLPYGVKMMRPDGKTILTPKGFTGRSFIFQEIGSPNETFGSIYGNINKMVLKPLSDFSDINSEAMKGLDVSSGVKFLISQLAKGRNEYKYLAYSIIKAMAAAHIDFAGLCDMGLAVNLNELTNKQ